MGKLFLRPNGNRVLVRMDKEAGKTAGGLYIPDSAEKDQRTATVVLAPDKYLTNSGYVSSPFGAGDRILVDAIGAMKLEVDGETFFVVRHEDIIGTFLEE